jgi:hypothetical protein
MMKSRLRALMLAAALAAAPALAAKDVAGISFEDKTKVGSAELSLNGAGVRTRAFFKVYAMGLYLPEKKTAADAVLGLKGAKRIQIVTLRDLSAQQFADALIEQLQKNLNESELAALNPSIEEFKATLLSIGSAPNGTAIFIDYLPESGTQLSVNRQPKGKAIAGEAFYQALLRIWLGAKPAQDDLKEALLGKSS